jgi:hypothetical protein
MTIKSIVELLAQADATIEDNTTGNITPSDVRTLIKDFLDTMSPAYGAINAPGITQVLSATPTSLKPFTATVAVTPSHFTTNLALGQVTRLVTSAGIAGATNFIIIDGNVEGPNGDLVTVELFKNGAPVGYSTSVSCTGAGEPVGFNLAAIDYTTSDTFYEVRVRGDAGSKIFTEVTLLAQAQPVRSFV